MSTFWTEKRCDLEGSRWDVWNKYYKSVIDWDEFKNEVVKINPSINNDSRWCLKKGWQYLMPSITKLNTLPHVDIDFGEMSNRNKLCQEILKKDGFYKGDIDGIIGSKSQLSLSYYTQIDQSRPLDEKVTLLIQITAKKNSIDTGIIDGYWGPQTDYAAEILYTLLSTGETPGNWRPEELDEKNPNNWPTQHTEEFYEFYGDPNSDIPVESVTLPYPHQIVWKPFTVMNKISCHKKVKKSLLTILEKVYLHYGVEEIKRLRLDQWGGCYNKRKIRGGSKLSMHSWGIAMDYDPVNNKLRWGRDRAAFSGKEYNYWWKCWEDEGWVSLGRQRNFDWMHIQAAKII